MHFIEPMQGLGPVQTAMDIHASAVNEQLAQEIDNGKLAMLIHAVKPRSQLLRVMTLNRQTDKQPRTKQNKKMKI